MRPPRTFLFFFFNDTATTEIYTLSLHDALPIAWPRNTQARAIHPRVDGRAAKNFLPPGVARNACHRPGSHVGISLLLPRARRNPEDFRNVYRPAHDDQLHSHRRLGPPPPPPPR